MPPKVEVLITRPPNFEPSHYKSFPVSRKKHSMPKKPITGNNKSSTSSQNRRPKSTESKVKQHRAQRDASQKKKNKLSLLEELKRKRKGLDTGPKREEEQYASASDTDSLFSASDSESDFIEEDGQVAVLPKEFQAQDHLSLQIKKVVQFFVHVAVRPPAERQAFMSRMLQTDEYFSIPLKNLRRRTSSLAETIKSLRWTPELCKRLVERHELELEPTVNRTVSKICDACNKENKNHCRVALLGGFKYEKMGFEEPPQKARKPSTHTFGPFCAQRIQAYHALCHWEYHLFSSIRNEVNQLHEAAQGKRIVNDRDMAVRIDYESLGAPKDLQDADAITEWLVERQFVKVEGDKLKQTIEMGQSVEKDARAGKTDS